MEKDLKKLLDMIDNIKTGTEYNVFGQIRELKGFAQHVRKKLERYEKEGKSGA